jgi:hypothetical protein
MSRRFWPCQAGGHEAMARSRMLEGVVGHHRAFGHLEDAAQAVARRACALRRVGREVFRIEHRLARRIVAGARIEHAQQARQRGDAAHRGARARRAALLLQGDRGRQPVDGIDRGHAHLVDEPARIRRDRFEIAPLRLGVERAEGQRRLARAGDAAEHHERVARDVDIDVAQVVFACAADAHEVIGAAGGFARHVFLPFSTDIGSLQRTTGPRCENRTTPGVGLPRAASHTIHAMTTMPDTDSLALIDACTQASLALLESNLTPHGILAASRTEAAVARRYTRIFGRDAAICVMAMCGSGVPALEQGAVASLDALAAQQAANGQIPKYVDPEGQDADFWYLGCIDATLWWLIAVDHVRRHGKVGPSHWQDGVARAIGWLLAQEHQHFRLLQQNEASDWADIMPRSGYVLYSNALWYDVKRRFALDHAEETQHHFNHMFNPFQRDLPEYHRARLLRHYARRGRRDPALYLSFVNFAFVGNEGDVFGNVLAIQAGLADTGDGRAHRGHHRQRAPPTRTRCGSCCIRCRASTNSGGPTWGATSRTTCTSTTTAASGRSSAASG